MARIRALKIGFFRNEDLCLLHFAHRLLFQGLWLLADREGVLEDRPRRIQAELFPFDPELNVDEMLTKLASGENPFIHRYVTGGRRYISVINFRKHQRPHHTEPPSEFPGPETGAILQPPDIHREHTVKTRNPHGDAPLGREGKGKDLEEGKEEGKGSVALARSATPPQELADAWNAYTTAPIPKCRELTDKRIRVARQRVSERDLGDWRTVIARIEGSRFCRGENDRGWVATFDWLLQPDTAVKVLEGKYDNRAVVVPVRAGRGARTAHAFDLAAEMLAAQDAARRDS